MSEDLGVQTNHETESGEDPMVKLEQAHQRVKDGTASKHDEEIVEIAEEVIKNTRDNEDIIDIEVVDDTTPAANGTKVLDPVDLDVHPVGQTPAIEPAPEWPAIEPAPERLAIEGSPDKLAIEPAPERKAIEAAPLPENPTLSFGAVQVKGTLKHVAEKATDKIEEEKAEIAATFAGLGKFRHFVHTIRMIPRNLKFSTMFKTETERKRGQEVMEGLLEAEQAEQIMSPARYMELIRQSDIEDVSARERAMFEAIHDSPEMEAALLATLTDRDLQRYGDTVRTGEGGEETPVIADFRAKLKERLLGYLDSSADDMLSDERQGELIAEYDFDVQELVRATIEANPGVFDEEAFMAMATNSFELAENSRAFLRHENGREALETALDTMRIDIGQLQIGPNSSYNTEYLERTTDRMRNRRVGRVLGKTSFVVGTWVLTGALAAGLSSQAVQSGTTSGLKYGLATAGTALGPLGTVVGFGVGVAASAIWGRYRARKGAKETIAMMEVKSGDSGEQETTELFQALQQDTISYTDTTDSLRGALTRPSVEDGVGEITLRDDLSPTELAQLISTVAEVRVRLGVERGESIDAAAGRAERAINLFSGSDASSVQSERVEMIQTLQLIEAQLEARYGEEGVPSLAEDGKPTSLDDLMASASAERATDLRARMAEVDQRREAFIRTRGRHGAAVAAIITAGVGIGAAGAAELISHGAAPTMYDTFGARGSTIAHNVAPTNPGAITTEIQTTRSGNTVALQHQGLGSSTVHLAPDGRQVTLTTPNGQPTTYGVNSHGLSNQAIIDLKSKNISVTQSEVPVPAKSVSQTEFITNKGGHTVEVRNWLADKQSTQHEIRASYNKDNDVYTLRYDSDDIASGNGVSYNIPQEAAAGNLRLYYIDPTTNKTVDVPFHIGKNGGIIVRTPASSDYHSLWSHDADGRAFPKVDIRVGVAVDDNTTDSVATLKTSYNGLIDTPASKQINIQLSPDADTVTSQPGVGYTIPGVAFSGDHAPLYKQGDKKPRPTPRPIPVTPPPNPTPQPTPPNPPQDTGPDTPPTPPRSQQDGPGPRPAIERAFDYGVEPLSAAEQLENGGFYNLVTNPDSPDYTQVRYLGRTEQGDYRFNDANGEFVYSAGQIRDITGRQLLYSIKPLQQQSGPRPIPISGTPSPTTPSAQSPRAINSREQPPAVEAAPAAAESAPQTEPTPAEPETPPAQVTPLSPEQILDKLGSDAIGTEARVNGDTYIIDGRQTVDGQDFVRLMPRSGGDMTFMPLATFDTALRGDSVRFDSFLGTPDAGPIVQDLRVGETLFDRSLGKNIRITGVDQSRGMTYRVLDDDRRQSGNKTLAAVKADIESGRLRPGSSRGVQLA